MTKHGSKLHPVVDAYVHTNKRLGEILTAVPEPRDPVVRVLLVLREALFKQRPAAEARALVENLDTTGADPNLLAILYSLWGRFSSAQERYVEAAALFKQAWALVNDRTPPEIKTLVMSFESVLYSGTGRGELAEARLVEVFTVLPKRSPRYANELAEWALHLAETGRGAESEAPFAVCFEKGRIKVPGARDLFFLIHYGETGRIEEAALCAAALRADNIQTIADSIAYYDTIVSVLQGRSEGKLPDWAATLHELLANHPEQALAHERRQAQLDSGFMYQRKFGHYNMIRVELANGQHEAARRLIRLRRQMGNTHYLDDFFLARVELLSGNREEAERRFAVAYRACQRYKAEKRLEIELRLACEMSRDDVMRLVAAAGRLAEKLPEKIEGAPPAPAAALPGPERLIGASPAMAAIRGTIKQIAGLDAPVLVTGETGTGKELVARAVHESGPRAAEPFLALNCGSIAESLLETELFGHEKGSFTGAAAAHRGLFEEAGRGTILLDEIGEMTPRIQVALLRVLEAGEVRPVGSTASKKIRCRIVAATNAELDVLVEKGAFRKDLLYRLKRLEIRVPPLRGRRDDVLPLAEHFLAEGRSDGARPRLSTELQAELRRRDWPGNVRELRNAMERMRLLNSDRTEYGLAEFEGEKPTPDPGPAGASEDDFDLATRQGCTSSGRLDLVRNIFRRRRKLARNDIIRALGVSQATATTYLKALCREGLVEKVMPTASPRTHYFRLRS